MGQPSSAVNLRAFHSYNPNAKPKKQATPLQISVLETAFKRNRWPDVQLCQRLSSEINKSPHFVKVWFQNRRAKVRIRAYKWPLTTKTSANGPKNGGLCGVVAMDTMPSSPHLTTDANSSSSFHTPSSPKSLIADDTFLRWADYPPNTEISTSSSVLPNTNSSLSLDLADVPFTCYEPPAISASPQQVMRHIHALNPFIHQDSVINGCQQLMPDHGKAIYGAHHVEVPRITTLSHSHWMHNSDNDISTMSQYDSTAFMGWQLIIMNELGTDLQMHYASTSPIHHTTTMTLQPSTSEFSAVSSVPSTGMPGPSLQTIDPSATSFKFTTREDRWKTTTCT